MDRLLLMVVVVAIVLVIYLSAYFILVTPATWQAETLTITLPEYRIGDTCSQWVFGPAHWCDRRIRPDVWSLSYWDPKTKREVREAQLGQDLFGW